MAEKFLGDEMSKLQIWLGIVWTATLLEGLWFVVAISIIVRAIPLSLASLLILLIFVGLSLLSFQKMPGLLLVSSILNLIGCVFIKIKLGGLPHPVWGLLYGHSVDIVIALFSILAFTEQRHNRKGSIS